MRIIAGKLKGRRLLAFNADNIRPTTDRVKESIFNKLMPYISNSRFLDLYSGTGNISIEAYSRGARLVVAIESHKKSLQIIEKNIKELKISGEIKVVNSDVFKYISSYKQKAYDVIMIDPPFTEKIAHKTMESVKNSSLGHTESIIVIESSSVERIDDNYGPWELWDRKSFGDKFVSFFTHENCKD